MGKIRNKIKRNAEILAINYQITHLHEYLNKHAWMLTKEQVDKVFAQIDAYYRKIEEIKTKGGK